jgi:hypothetical protein
MSTQSKTITREELYQALWQTPMSKLAATWGVPIAGIVKACVELKVPRPASGHWQLVARGWDVEREPLPPAEEKTPLSVVIKAGQKRSPAKPVQASEASAAPATQPQYKIPKNLDNAHPLVKQTRQELKGSYLHHGLIQGGSPLSVEVSPDQQNRALCIMDAIVKAVVGMGGRFEQEKDSWCRHFLMGKQPVWFYMTEVKKRITIDPELDEEERKARGYSSWEKYEWKGGGLLRFKITGHKYVDEQVWTETTRYKMENLVPEIIERLARVEEDGKANQEWEAEQNKIAAEKQRLRDIEWRREYEENERRKSLVETSERWHQAQKLRQFVRACERELQKKIGLPPGTAATIWLEWARAHAARLDPIKQGYLQNLVKETTA